MIELIVSYFLLPFMKKLGEKVIDEAVDNAVDEADDSLKTLFKSAFNDSGDKQKLLNRLKNDSHAAERFERMSANLLPQIAKQMSSIADRASKMEYYASVLEGLGAIAVRRKSDLVISGFLNGTDYVTVIAPPDFNNNPQVDKRDGTVFAFNTGAAPMDIYLKRCKDSKERNEEVIRLRELAKGRVDGNIPSDTVKEFYSLAYIYVDWVSLKGLKYADIGLDEPKWSSPPTPQERSKNRKSRQKLEEYDGRFIEVFYTLPNPLKDLLKINNCDGLELMLQSVTELIKEEAKDLDNLRKISGAGE
jgi:hypothetical protein